MALETLTKPGAGRGELKRWTPPDDWVSCGSRSWRSWGSRHVGHPRDRGQLVAKVPGARKVVIAGAGHMVNLEQPTEFNRTLMEFLRSRDRR